MYALCTLFSCILHITLAPTSCFFFFFNDTATTEIYTLSLHDALPISIGAAAPAAIGHHQGQGGGAARLRRLAPLSPVHRAARGIVDRHDLGAGVRVEQEERDRHPPGGRRLGAGLDRKSVV